MKRLTWIIPVLALLMACTSSRDDGTIPALFARDVISTAFEEYRVTFAPDGKTIYFGRSQVFFPVSREATILVSRYESGTWTPPESASFSGKWPDIDPFITRDGQRIYFSSIRPVDGIERKDSDIWYVDWQGGGWSEPVNVAAVNTPADELYPSIAPDGALYFGSDRPDGRGGWDLWMARSSARGFSSPVNLHDVNSPEWEFNPTISPDGQYLVFTSIGRTEGIGMGDLYTSWSNGPTWSFPVHLNPWANSPADEYHPTFSPDGQTLYFVRRQSLATGGDIYAVPWNLVQP